MAAQRKTQLFAVHKLTIATAVVGCLAFAAWGIWHWAKDEKQLEGGLGIIALLVAAGLVLYLRDFSRKHR